MAKKRQIPEITPLGQDWIIKFDLKGQCQTNTDSDGDITINSAMLQSGNLVHNIIIPAYIGTLLNSRGGIDAAIGAHLYALKYNNKFYLVNGIAFDDEPDKIYVNEEITIGLRIRGSTPVILLTAVVGIISFGIMWHHYVNTDVTARCITLTDKIKKLGKQGKEVVYLS